MNAKIKMSERLYHRYEYLAPRYASRIFSYEQLSYEYEDLVQEFRIKIFTSIKAYGRRWLRYRRGESPKPVPLKYYLEAACSNKMRDFTKYITRENNKTSIDEIHYDYGVNDDTTISPERNIFIVNGVNLLEGLTGKERAVFSLYLRGCNKSLLNKVYFSNKEEKRLRKEVLETGDEPFGVADIIDLQKSYLIRKYGNDLLQQNRVFSTYNFDEE